MEEFPWDVLIGCVALAVALFAFLWEFVFIGRKSLGYRWQMDTTTSGLVTPDDAQVSLLTTRGGNGGQVNDPSIALLRIENTGMSNITPSDYAGMPSDEEEDRETALRVEFPGRRVVGLVVTEISQPHITTMVTRQAGLRIANRRNGEDHVGVIELPAVPLNRRDHYKLLIALERGAGAPPRFPPPLVVGGIQGGRMRQTRNRIGPSWKSTALAATLSLALATLVVISLNREDPAPLDCARGDLTVVGSTAFQRVVEQSAAMYRKTCPEARIQVEAAGSGAGLRRLDEQGRQGRGSALVAFSDGPKPDGFPGLLPRPTAFSLFSLVIHPDAGVQDLSTDQIRRLYEGGIANWNEVGGADVPVVVISREPGSGTRTAFQRRVLGGEREPATNSDDCRTLDPGGRPGAVRCERATTEEVLNTVAHTRGAIGYSEAKAAAERADLRLVRIDGHPATLDGADRGAYPFWETEYAYTYGEPPADSVAASFLRYLTNEVGKDIIRTSGNRPCAELENPQRCAPAQ
ncbi:PstS family phosphate ABC transporter substrate-binding protein [Saccharothrix obliqua]|uniref:PstS family phosphate ABC transporter substrate-binding protein n=1 Tax=Saccharothrix obliqua TaxID=2861747 RepID=UPI001C6033D3|nr:substrate-binding domain-containing protein [Saccharothrix obliqua]MBW4721259.1 substrate-binding domain-containing protein [Saccharothrix obliqua]